MATLDDVARMMLTDIGAPITPSNVTAMKVWINAENSNPTLRNNPLNLHAAPGTWPGQTGSVYVNSNDQNVAVFGTIEAGVSANAQNLKNLAVSHPEYGYQQVLDAFRAGNSLGALQALGNSAWAASHYRAKDANGNYITGSNTLVDAFLGQPSGTSKGSPGTNSSNSGNPVADWWANLLQVDTSHVLTEADYNRIKSYFIAANPPSSFNNNASPDQVGTAFDGAFHSYIGHPLSTMNPDIFGADLNLQNLAQHAIDYVEAQGAANLGAKAGSIAGGVISIPGVSDAISFLGVVLVGIVFIGAGAIIMLRKKE